MISKERREIRLRVIDREELAPNPARRTDTVYLVVSVPLVLASFQQTHSLMRV